MAIMLIKTNYHQLEYNRIMPSSDEQLIKAYRSGDDGALRELIDKHSPSIYRFIYRLIGKPAEVTDVTQEVFIKMWKNLPAFKPEKNFKAWLFTIAHHTAIDHLRRKKPLLFSQLDTEESAFADTLADPEPLADNIISNRELGERLTEALETIRPEHRTIVLLHIAHDLTFLEIAEIVHKPLNTVKSQYRRALALVHRQLQKNNLHQK